MEPTFQCIVAYCCGSTLGQSRLYANEPFHQYCPNCLSCSLTVLKLLAEFWWRLKYCLKAE